MSMGSGGPEGPDAFSLDRVGRGARGGRGGGTTLERRRGDEWVVVQRYGDAVAAAQALDEAVAGGGPATKYRLVTDDHRGVQRAVLFGGLALAVVVLVSLWLIID
jgi:hypothetical protein